MRVQVPPAGLTAAAPALRSAGFTWRVEDGTVELRTPTLDADALAALERLTGTGAPVHIEQPALADVFRQLVAEQRRA